MIYSNKRYSRKVSASKLYTDYIELMNGKWRLTFRESQVLAYLMKIDARETGEDKNVVGTKERKEMIKELMLNKHNLSVYIRKFKQQKILIPSGKKSWVINPVFMPGFDENGQMTITHILNKIED